MVWCSDKSLYAGSFVDEVVHIVPSATHFEMPMVAFVNLPVAADTIVEPVDIDDLVEAVHADKTYGGHDLMSHLMNHSHCAFFVFDSVRCEIGIGHLVLLVVRSSFDRLSV